MRDTSDRRSSPSTFHPQATRKRLGGYLIEAGLLTQAQVDVALNDQKLTGMRFGEILATRGWVKQQTIEYLMEKVIVPEREGARQQKSQKPTVDPNATLKQTRPTIPPSNSDAPKEMATDGTQRQTITRRDIPIAKPLPSVNTSDEDVSWVG
jgi:hypothetical protein